MMANTLLLPLWALNCAQWHVISTLKLFTPTQPACTDVLTHTHTNTLYTHTQIIATATSSRGESDALSPP